MDILIGISIIICIDIDFDFNTDSGIKSKSIGNINADASSVSSAHNFFLFSPNRPTGLIRSSSRDVCP